MKTNVTRFIVVLAAVLILPGVSCSDPGEDALAAAESCGARECPVGTAFKEMREVRIDSEVEVGGSVGTNYSADGAFSRFGEGSCEYACEVMQPCPEPTFPVITLGCFTCAVLNAEGKIQQPEC